MVKLLTRLVRGAVLVALLVLALLAVGKFLQHREVLPGAVTPTPPPNATVSAAGDGRDPKVAPSGYAQSCAAASPWGQPVTKPFVCVESPRGGDAIAPAFTIRGYAGGAFEQALVATFVAEMTNGTRVPAQDAIRVPVTYTTPAAGTPGMWQLSVNLGGLPEGDGRLHIEVFAERAQGGARIAETKLELRLQR